MNKIIIKENIVIENLTHEVKGKQVILNCELSATK